MEEKLEKNCRKLIGNEDTFVITGDHCWGKNLSEAKTDLAFIADLPGNKILLRGNHDMFWDAKKTAVLNQEYEPQLHFLQNNHYHYQDYALVGTKDIPLRDHSTSIQKGRLSDGMKPMRNRPKSW